MTNFYVRFGNVVEPRGPFSLAELAAFVEGGSFPRDMLVGRRDDEVWLPYSVGVVRHADGRLDWRGDLFSGSEDGTAKVFNSSRSLQLDADRTVATSAGPTLGARPGVAARGAVATPPPVPTHRAVGTQNATDRGGLRSAAPASSVAWWKERPRVVAILGSVALVVASSLVVVRHRADNRTRDQQIAKAVEDARAKLEADTAAKAKADVDAKAKAITEAKKSVDDAMKAFGSAPNAERRRDTYLTVLDALAKTTALLDASTYAGLRAPTTAPFFGRLTAIRAGEVVDEKGAPNIPPKPEHDPPKYAGAYQLSGQVRKCYKDGVVLQSGSKFYFLSDGKCPDVNYLYGYVEDAGRTVNVEIGRDGRDAEVVNIRDKESAADDRAAHSKAVADYETEYAKKLKQYQDATNGKEAVVAALEKRRSARKAEREAIWKSLDLLLLPLATAAAAGTDLSTVPLPPVALAAPSSYEGTATPAVVAAQGAAEPAPTTNRAGKPPSEFKPDPYATKPDPF